MINISKFLKKIKKIDKILFVLPNGLFTIDNEYIDKSFLIIDELKLNTGTAVKLINIDFHNAKLNNLSNYFEVLNLFSNKPFNSVDESDLNIDIMLNEITNFKFDKSKNPYENFLEVTLLIYLMESISSRKSLLSGIWGGKQVVSNIKGQSKGNYTGLVENIAEKNLILKKIREYLYQYPKIFFDNLKEYEDREYNPNESQYAVFLNYRILQIKYKILLQDRCILLNNMNDEVKININEKIHNIKQIMQGYPVLH